MKVKAVNNLNVICFFILLIPALFAGGNCIIQAVHYGVTSLNNANGLSHVAYCFTMIISGLLFLQGKRLPMMYPHGALIAIVATAEKLLVRSISYFCLAAEPGPATATFVQDLIIGAGALLAEVSLLAFVFLLMKKMNDKPVNITRQIAQLVLFCVGIAATALPLFAQGVTSETVVLAIELALHINGILVLQVLLRQALAKHLLKVEDGAIIVTDDARGQIRAAVA